MRDIVNSLPATDKAFDATGLPPYAGFHLEAERGTIIGKARHLEVYDGVILLEDRDLEQLGHLEDPEYEVEPVYWRPQNATWNRRSTTKHLTGFAS